MAHIRDPISPRNDLALRGRGRWPPPRVVAWADRIAYVCHDYEDALRSGVLTAGDLPTDVCDVVGLTRSRQIDAFVSAVLKTIDETGSVGMSLPVADALAAFRAFNFERIYLRPASVRQADRVIALLRGLVDYFVDMPTKIPHDATGWHAHLESGSQAAAEIAVRYISGMTDRYALGLGVELLGWRPEALPRGV